MRPLFRVARRERRVGQRLERLHVLVEDGHTLTLGRSPRGREQPRVHGLRWVHTAVQRVGGEQRPTSDRTILPLRTKSTETREDGQGTRVQDLNLTVHVRQVPHERFSACPKTPHMPRATLAI